MKEQPGTTSLSDEVLQELAADESLPRRAAHAARELERRAR